MARRAGIGINAGRIRGINSKIRGGEVQHTGVIPFLKKFESTVRCCTQNGVRGGNATVHFPIWHPEIEDILVLKNNKGTEDNRVRRMDYSIQISKLFYERFMNEEDITLISPHLAPGLYEAFGTEEFDDLYLKYEADKTIPKKTVPAQDLFFALSFKRSKNRSCAETFFLGIVLSASYFRYKSSNSSVPNASYNPGARCGEIRVMSSSFMNLS